MTEPSWSTSPAQRDTACSGFRGQPRVVRLTILTCWLLAVARPALAPLQRKSPGGEHPASPVTLRVTTTLVEVDVVVRDKHGHAVRDLKQDDFELYDQGKAQRIQLFALPPNGALPSPSGPVATPAPVPSPAAPRSPAQTYTNRKAGGQERRSVTVILIDPLDMWCQEWPRNRDGIIKFLRQASPANRIGIYVMNWNGVSILHDVTQDSSALIKNLASWNAELGHESHHCAAGEILSGANVGADFGFLLSGPPAQVGRPTGIRNPHDTNFLSVGDVGLTPNTYATVRKLKLFEALAHHLAAVPGRKNVIWVSDGFPISGFAGGQTGHAEAYGYGREEEEAMRVVNQANVAIYSFDAGWLRARLPHGELGTDPLSPSVASVPSDVVASNPQAPALTSGLQWAQTRFTTELALEEISEDTGGRAYLDTNDMVGSLRNAYDDSNDAYTLGFYPEEPRFKGEFHSLKVKVKDRPDLRLYYRKGYVDAPMVGDIKSELEDAAWSPFDASGIGLTAALTSVKRRQAILNVSIALDGLSLESDGKRWKGTIHVVLVQKDDQGRQYNSVDQTINLALKPETYRKLLRSGFGFHESVPINLQAISLRVIVVDGGSHNLGSLTIPVTTPNSSGGEDDVR